MPSSSGQNTNCIGAALDLAARASDWVGGRDLDPVRARGIHVCEDSVARGVEEGSELGLLLAQCLGEGVTLDLRLSYRLSGVKRL